MNVCADERQRGYWDQAAQLYRWAGPAALMDPLWRSPPVMRGTLADVVRALRRRVVNDLWRYAVSSEDRPLICGAELGSLYRRNDVPEFDDADRQLDMFAASYQYNTAERVHELQ
jgi:hypothetical protein